MSNKITCYNCNGLGEKTRSRGNHSSIHRTTKCYTCAGSGKLNISTDSLKNSIIYYLNGLKRESIKTDITALWNEVKSWSKDRHYIMGGSYASWQTIISVNILIDSQRFRFTIAFSELG